MVDWIRYTGFVSMRIWGGGGGGAMCLLYLCVIRPEVQPRESSGRTNAIWCVTLMQVTGTGCAVGLRIVTSVPNCPYAIAKTSASMTHRPLIIPTTFGRLKPISNTEYKPRSYLSSFQLTRPTSSKTKHLEIWAATLGAQRRRYLACRIWEVSWLSSHGYRGERESGQLLVRRYDSCWRCVSEGRRRPDAK
ncbi:hypothetical protein BKA65DRAFT_239205 [Rhexocercosporidium sp. MPI-PUGE-AT-0058]|nr:hypothetical protein BKA65DRAFT_239205 [Rhexocercosporidium sp. MPI-PUGE-AT-0058]